MSRGGKIPKMSVKSITRNIQWYGLLRFPNLDEGDRIHWWRLIADMMRRPSGEYRNEGIWQPPRGFWGNVCLRRDGRVARSAQLQFQNQIVFEESYLESFLHQSISCHLDSVHKSIANLGLALGAIPISAFNPIKDWNPYSLLPSDFSIKMISENAVGKFILEYDIIPKCSVFLSDPPPPPPPPPPPDDPEPLDPEEPFEDPISDAYDGNDDDGETYDPDPDDDGSDSGTGGFDFPIGENCDIYKITIRYWMLLGHPDDPGTETYGYFYAPIEDVYLGKYQASDDNNSVLVRSAGRIDINECSPGQIETIVANHIERFELISIEKV